MSNPLDLQALAEAIPPFDADAAQAAQARLDSLTKPQGSLGQLEPLLVRMAGATGQPIPQFDRPVLLLAAADHGVAHEGVSAYPQAVTAQMVANYLAGGAAINVLAAHAGARLLVVDAGVIAEVPEHPALRRLNIRAGSGNMLREPALLPHEASAALQAGLHIVDELWKAGDNLLVVGEMGIGNTTAAAALTAVFTGENPQHTVGRGTGIDNPTLERKRLVVAQAIARAGLPQQITQPVAAFRALCEVGGLEIAVLAGAMLGAAARRIPILLDGYITTSAALVAAAIAPRLCDYLIAAHRSAEYGHAFALAQLGLQAERGRGPLLQLDLRLGEGSGAALALPLLQAASKLLRDMATFAQAGVSERSEKS